MFERLLWRKEDTAEQAIHRIVHWLSDYALTVSGDLVALSYGPITSKFALNSVLQLSHGWRSGNYTHRPSEKLCLAYGEKKKELGELKKPLAIDHRIIDDRHNTDSI